MYVTKCFEISLVLYYEIDQLLYHYDQISIELNIDKF